MKTTIILIRLLRYKWRQEIGPSKHFFAFVLCFIAFLILINWLDAHGLNWVNNTYRY